MEIIKASDCKTLEEYRAYQRQKSKIWYQNNREKKIKYQKNRKKLSAVNNFLPLV